MFDTTDTKFITETKRQIYVELSHCLYQFPDELRVYLLNNAILSGGAIPSLMNNEKPNDYDLYLNDINHIEFFKKYVQVMDKSLLEDVDVKYLDATVSGKLVTANATTFKNKIQVITLHAANARTTFDFVHCMPWYDLSKNLLYISKKQYDIIKSKILIKNEHPNAYHLSQKRIDKFIERGWRFKNLL